MLILVSPPPRPPLPCVFRSAFSMEMARDGVRAVAAQLAASDANAGGMQGAASGSEDVGKRAAAELLACYRIFVREVGHASLPRSRAMRWRQASGHPPEPPAEAQSQVSRDQGKGVTPHTSVELILSPWGIWCGTTRVRTVLGHRFFESIGVALDRRYWRDGLLGCSSGLEGSAVGLQGTSVFRSRAGLLLHGHHSAEREERYRHDSL